MENATKALLISAAVLLAVMLVSLLVIAYNRISSYYQQSSELLTIEQLDKFNRQFQNYSGREDIRGNELISLMNKIIDYNVSQAYQEGTNYDPIKVTIKIGDFVDSFRYESDGTILGAENNYIKETIQNTVNNVNNQANDKNLTSITYTPSESIAEAANVGISLTDTQLQKLSAEISYILIDEDATDNRSIDNRRIRATLLRSILKLDVGTDSDCDLRLDNDGNYTIINSEGQDKIEVIKEITSRYYQYTQFKRACFKCTDVIHSTETDRVVEMNFEVMTEDQNGQTVVKFD